MVGRRVHTGQSWGAQLQCMAGARPLFGISDVIPMPYCVQLTCAMYT